MKPTKQAADPDEFRYGWRTLAIPRELEALREQWRRLQPPA